MNDTGWWVVRSGAPAPGPDDPPPGPEGDWLPAVVPGSVAACPAVVAEDPMAVELADDHTWWWWRRVTVTAADDYDLAVDEISTYATYYVDGRRVGTTDNAFRSFRLGVGHLDAGEHDVHVRIAALHEVDVPARPRARWRSSLVPDRSLRRRRTPLLGRIPSWPGTTAPVGILGRCDLVPARTPVVTRVDVDLPRSLHDARPASPTDAAEGVVTVRLAGLDTADRDGVTCLLVDDASGATSEDPPTYEATWAAAPDGTAVATVRVPHPRRWWPHTHGAPHTYRLVVTYSGATVLERRIGFSSVVADRTDDRFALVVNGVRVFVRGACWVPVDAVTWRDDPAAVEADLARLASAGFNLVRVTGTNRYESQAFWDVTARLGLLVWHDVMLATADPPEDDPWLDDFAAEVRDRLTRLQGRPNVAVVCGGSETLQQPTLLGLDPGMRIRALHEVLPQVAVQVLPAAPLVESSPSGGPLPVSIEHGVCHYFGVGAYERDLADALTARVSFASEALAFAIPAERASVAEAFGGDGPVSSRPEWVGGTPRDRGVDWDFTHTSAHYVERLFGLRSDDVDDDTWLDLNRAAVAHVMATTFAAWRSGATPTSGAIVLSHRDLADGPGWGLIDVRHRPKAPLLALRDVLAPRAVLAVDRGLEGVGLWLVDDSGPADDDATTSTDGSRGRSGTDRAPETSTSTLRLEVYSEADRPVAEVQVDVEVPSRGSLYVHVEQALGGFRDLGWAWRFGSPTYRFLRATWSDHDGRHVAETVVPLGPLGRLVPAAAVRGGAAVGGGRTHAAVADDTGTDAQVHAARLTATHTYQDGTLHVTVTTDRPVPFVHLDAPGWVARTGWLHVVPGHPVTIVADPDPAADPAHDETAAVRVRSLATQAVRSRPCAQSLP